MTRAPFLALLVCCAIVGPSAGQDIVHSVTAGGVGVDIFVPGDAKPVRGLLLYASDYKQNKDKRWDEFCRQVHFGHVVLSIPGGGKGGSQAGGRDDRLLKALRAALKDFAEQHDRLEVVNVPWVATGNSSYWRSFGLLHAQPDRAIGHCVLAGKVTDPATLDDRQKAIPVLYTFGGKADSFNEVGTVGKFYDPARKQGLPWTLAVARDCAYLQPNTAAIAMPWLHAVIDARLPPEPPADGVVKLKEFKIEDGWLGDRSATSAPAIAPYAEFTGDKETAVWLPSRYVAHVWRAFQTNDFSVTLSAQSSYEHWFLPQYNPEQPFELSIYPVHSLELGLRLPRSLAMKKVRYYDGDRLIGEATRRPWQFRWQNIPRGYHMVYAQWESENGRSGITFPGFISVKWDYPVKK